MTVTVQLEVYEVSASASDLLYCGVKRVVMVHRDWPGPAEPATGSEQPEPEALAVPA